MANFLFLIGNIVEYSKKDIDQGNTPPEIYKICVCLKETYCISFNIRKENNVYLYFQNERILIKFEGSTLRFLGMFDNISFGFCILFFKILLF